jgi:hypothetical protein
LMASSVWPRAISRTQPMPLGRPLGLPLTPFGHRDLPDLATTHRFRVNRPNAFLTVALRAWARAWPPRPSFALRSGALGSRALRSTALASGAGLRLATFERAMIHPRFAGIKKPARRVAAGARVIIREKLLSAPGQESKQDKVEPPRAVDPLTVSVVDQIETRMVSEVGGALYQF